MKQFLFICLILLAFDSYSQKITRGPDIGEIYFMGPTATVLYQSIYHSIDFGESAVCVDSISASSNFIEAITADKTSGGLYFVTMGEALYYSGDYDQYGTWEFKHGNITSPMRSGVTEGFFYKYIASHSENYGGNFISHNLNGFFGSGKDIAIDINQGTCYCISEVYGVNDTLYFFISNNNFNDLEVRFKFNLHWSNNVLLSRSNNSGSLFLCNATLKEVHYSEDFGESWGQKNILTCPNLPIKGITGGKQDGELYLLVEYLQMMGQRRHVYIYHSLDYGESFTIYHPIAIGPDPIYANFNAEDTLVEPGDTIQFTDLSNDAETWEWDFNFDGTIDSYEQNPTFFYQDTGYYTVILSITGAVVQDYGIRYDYIHVIDFTNTSEQELRKEINFYPNPFTNHITIEFPSEKNNNKIFIYDIAGQLVNSLQKPQTSIKLVWDGKDKNGNKCKPGIYFVRIENNSFSKKILLIK